METLLQLPSEITKVTTMANGAIRIVCDSNEGMTNEQLSKVMACHGKYGHFCFLPGERTIDSLDIVALPDLPKRDDEEKSPSTRYRSVLWILWEKEKPTPTIEEFYRRHYEKLIEAVKAKLT